VLAVVGDCSGKGIPAALFMAVTMTLIRSAARQFASPDEIVRHANTAVCGQQSARMILTLSAAS